MVQELMIMEYHICLFLTWIACIAKCFMMNYLLKEYTRKKIAYIAATVLLIIFVGQIISDIAWINLITFKILSIQGTILTRFMCRIAWLFCIIEYQALSYLVENVLIKQYSLSLRQKLFFLMTGLLVFFSILFLVLSPFQYHLWEIWLFRRIIGVYAMFFLIAPSFAVALRRVRNAGLPAVLVQQHIIFLKFLGVFLATNCFSVFLRLFSVLDETAIEIIASRIPAVILTVALAYYAFRMRRLRFLNMESRVTLPALAHLHEALSDAYNKLLDVSTRQEIILIIEHFLTHGLSLPDKSIMIHIPYGKRDEPVPAESKQVDAMWKFFVKREDFLASVNREGSVLFYQDLHFSNWYSHNTFEETATEFLDTVSADIFVPMVYEDQFLGCIFISRSARPERLYSKHEYEVLSMLGKYVAQTITTMVQKECLSRHQGYNELQRQVFEHHQRLLRVQDGLHALVQKQVQKEIGLVTFKHAQFDFLNDAAEKLLPCNPNIHKGHPVAALLLEIATKVLAYKQPIHRMVKGHQGQSLSCVAQLFEQTTVLIIICCADFSDIITLQLLAHTNPADIDYVLALQTTESGRLIDQLLPTSQEPILSLKIALLKGALSKRALWIEGHDEDVDDVVHMMHGISLKEVLHIMTITEHSNEQEIRAQLFGVKDLFVPKTQAEQPLLVSLHNRGTLFIKNVDLLSHKMQEDLAEYIAFGQFYVEKYGKPMFSDVRIICTSKRPIRELGAGIMKENLYELFRGAVISIPDIQDLSDTVKDDLIKNVSSQSIEKPEVVKLFEVSRTEVEQIQTPRTLRALRTAIQACLEKRAKELTVDENIFDKTVLTQGDQLIFEAAKCGRQGLKDKVLMHALWDRFKNYNKIAHLLQVDRSSVFRCLKKYGYIS